MTAAVIGTGAAVTAAPAQAAAPMHIGHIGHIGHTRLAAATHQTPRSLLGGLLTATQLPTLTGDAVVGQALGLTDPVWSLLGVSDSYQWLRDGVPIDGATSATYLPTAADAGHQLAAQVTGTLAGLLPVSVLSNLVAVPLAGGGSLPDPVGLVATVLPQLSGTAGVGRALQLTGLDSMWNLSGVTTSVQWLRDGMPILGATGQSYLPTTADAGHLISARITGALAGLLPVSLLSSTTLIPALTSGDPTGAVTALVLPLLSGVPVVGDALSVAPGAWSVPGVSTTVQWLSNGVPIPGATGLSLPLTSDLAGTDISALVTGTLAGLPVVSVLTSALGVAPTSAASLLSTAVPTLGSAARVGEPLTATAPVWKTDGVTTTYQWLRNGVAIPGATSLAYTPTIDDLAKQLTLKAVGTKGSATGSVTSSPLLVMVGAALTPLTKPQVTGSAKPGGLLSIAPGSWSGTALPTFGYQWYRNGKAISGATGAQYLVTAADAGHSLAVLVSAVRTGLGVGQAASNVVSIGRLASRTALSASTTHLRPGTRPVVAVLLAATGARPAGTVRIVDGKRTLTTTKVRGRDNGRRLVRLPALKPGTHRLRAVFAGGGATAGSTSKVLRLVVARHR